MSSAACLHQRRLHEARRQELADEVRRGRQHSRRQRQPEHGHRSVGLWRLLRREDEVLRPLIAAPVVVREILADVEHMPVPCFRAELPAPIRGVRLPVVVLNEWSRETLLRRATVLVHGVIRHHGRIPRPQPLRLAFRRCRRRRRRRRWRRILRRSRRWGLVLLLRTCRHQRRRRCRHRRLAVVVVVVGIGGHGRRHGRRWAATFRGLLSFGDSGSGKHRCLLSRNGPEAGKAIGDVLGSTSSRCRGCGN
mmetsp:Transcript_54003/g.155072  ORF Transcript_54003/g.155072 Transcript_54003/m.155072 type:complete len:250 (-) Transcript_54003:303-1052(-)